MILPDIIVEKGIYLKDQYFDLRGLEAYSGMKVSLLRSYIRSDNLPCFQIKGKIFIRRSEFDRWVNQYRINRNQNINNIVNEVMNNLKSDC
jgi:hypothetical protein